MATSRIIPTCKCSSHTGLYSFTRLILRTFPTLMSVCILFPLSEMPFFPSVLKKLGQGFGRLALSSLFSVLLKHSLHWYIVSVLHCSCFRIQGLLLTLNTLSIMS